MKALTDNTGEKANPVNPFEKWKSLSYKDEEPTKEWADFDKAHPSVPLTERQLPNVIIEVEVVERVKIPISNEWVILRDEAAEDFKLQFPNKQYDQAYKPIAPIDEEKGLEDDIYDAVADYRKTHTQPIPSQSASIETVEQAADDYIKSIANTYSDFVKLEIKAAFIACAQWQSNSQQQVDNWISVEYRLPEKLIPVLCLNKQGYMKVGGFWEE